MNFPIESVSLEHLILNEDLSVRAVNVCRRKDLNSLNEIIEFYNENDGFTKIRNCGLNTEKELLSIIQKYSRSYFSIPIKYIDNVQNRIKSLNPFQKSILNRHIDYLISRLSARGQNGLHSMQQFLNRSDWLEEIFSLKFQFNEVKNIGKKTVDELNIIKIEISNFIEQLETTPNESLGMEYAKAVLKSSIGNLSVLVNRDIESIFDVNGKIRLFYLIDLLVQSDTVFNKNEKAIFNDTYLESDIEYSTINALSITKERIRQIKIKLKEDIEDYFSFISNFTINDIVNYGVDDTHFFQVIDNTHFEKIKEIEDVKFNFNFYCAILAIFLKNTHSILGDYEISIKKRLQSDKGRSRNCYIISNLFFEAFDFLSFMKDIDLKLSEKILETYSLHFIGYLCQFLKKDGKHLLDSIISACEIVLFNEFDIVPDSSGYLVFERNKKIQLHEYCYIILKEFSRQMTVDEIEKVIKERYSDLKFTSSSIRGSLLRERELFICFGRTSTYALREWETEKANIRGGTIRDIVFDFLQQQEGPLHISAIWKHVESFRGTTYARSVLDNLKADESNRFRFMEGSFIGLTSKSYDISILNLKRLIGSQFTLKVLRKYNGWILTDVINQYIQKYNYQYVQVEYVIQNKIDDGEITLTTDNKLII